MVSRLSIDIPGFRGLIIGLVLCGRMTGDVIYTKNVELHKNIPFQVLEYILSYQIIKAVF